MHHSELTTFHVKITMFLQYIHMHHSLIPSCKLFPGVEANAPNHAVHNYLVNKQRFTYSTDHEVVLYGAPLQKMSGSSNLCLVIFVTTTSQPYVGYPNLPRGM